MWLPCYTSVKTTASTTSSSDSIFLCVFYPDVELPRSFISCFNKDSSVSWSSGRFTRFHHWDSFGYVAICVSRFSLSIPRNSRRPSHIIFTPSLLYWDSLERSPSYNLVFSRDPPLIATPSTSHEYSILPSGISLL